MRELASLAAEIADYEAFEKFRHGRTGPSANVGRASRLASTLKVDLVNTAMLVAAATSLANAMQRGAACASGPRALAVFGPAPSARLASAVDRLVAEEIDAGVCEALQSFAAHLQLVQRMSTAFIAGGDVDADAGRPVDAEVLADAWRRTCATAADAIAALAALATASNARAGATGKALALLAEAGAGGTPCLDPDGRIDIPGWAERRRDARYDTQKSAMAHCDGVSTPVNIRDLSASGIGLDVPSGARPGDRLTLRLPSGREITGTVAWAGGRRAGLKLDRRLPDDDPLFAAASRAVTSRFEESE